MGLGAGAGLSEDPVTGSAHCQLAPLWAERLGKQEMMARQASARGGTVPIEFAGERTILTGVVFASWKALRSFLAEAIPGAGFPHCRSTSLPSMPSAEPTFNGRDLESTVPARVPAADIPVDLVAVNALSDPTGRCRTGLRDCLWQSERHDFR
ncbi:PhzF family phenazine biosynthesis protein [Arthrobacter glacialis]|uniref:PhzF family phenazine biosynthesis protein n=1 Tax=Arthrobacter glacialis TaxID=1664 RepID=UPI001A9C762A